MLSIQLGIALVAQIDTILMKTINAQKFLICAGNGAQPQGNAQVAILDMKFNKASV
jgi:hypothetical protein